MTTPVWRKSSRSYGNGGNCVEIALAPGRVAARDSKNPDGGVLVFSEVTWRAFLTTLR